MAASIPYPKLRGVSVRPLVVSAVMLVLVLVPHIGTEGRRRAPLARGLVACGFNRRSSRSWRWSSGWRTGWRRRNGASTSSAAVCRADGCRGDASALGAGRAGLRFDGAAGLGRFAMMFVAGVRLRFLVPTILSGVAGICRADDS